MRNNNESWYALIKHNFKVFYKYKYDKRFWLIKAPALYFFRIWLVKRKAYNQRLGKSVVHSYIVKRILLFAGKGKQNLKLVGLGTVKQCKNSWPLLYSCLRLCVVCYSSVIWRSVTLVDESVICQGKCKENLFLFQFAYLDYHLMPYKDFIANFRFEDLNHQYLTGKLEYS